jgi:hypothetical protein
MPVLVTIATITYLFKGAPEDQPGFFNPAALRAQIEALSEGPARTEALEILDQLDALAREYDDATDAAMGAYIADVEKYDSTADDLISDLLPPDQIRMSTLPKVIRLRERLVEALSEAEWDEVFG